MTLMSIAVTDDKTTVSSRPTVLVVDDEAGPRDALKVILRPFFNIRLADNAKAALDILNELPIDLITLDQKLPDRQGIDLLQDIKHDYAETEVIIITGYGSLKSAMEGIRHGAAGYLLKPFNVTELITLINQTLEKKQRLDFIRQFLHSLGALGIRGALRTGLAITQSRLFCDRKKTAMESARVRVTKIYWRYCPTFLRPKIASC